MNRKSMIVCFAVFAATLMLMTTCIAAPVQQKASIEAVESVQEKVSIDAVGSAQQELISSIKAMCLRLKNDLYFNSLVKQISNDIKLKTIASAIQNTEDLDKKISLASSYVDVLKNKQEFTDLIKYFESSYSSDVRNIIAQLNELYPVLSAGIISQILYIIYLFLTLIATLIIDAFKQIFSVFAGYIKAVLAVLLGIYNNISLFLDKIIDFLIDILEDLWNPPTSTTTSSASF